MTGFLNDLNLTSIEEDPNALPVGDYPGFISNMRIIDQKDNTRALIITYKVDADHPLGGRTKDEFKTMPEMIDGVDEVTGANIKVPKSPKDATNGSYIKQRIKSLGVPENELNNFTKEDLLGTKVTFSIKERGEYKNVTKVTLREEYSEDTLANLI